MNRTKRYHTLCAACALIVLCVSATQSHGAVTADPASTTFNSPQQSATIRLTNDGVPIPASAIRAWRFLASGHDYKHMLKLEKLDGAINIAPSATMEVGSYDLNIETTHGSVNVQVFAPLSDLPDIVEKTAALTGLSEERIKERLGLATVIGRDEVQISLPPVYYEGQTLELTMATAPRPERNSSWFMNGELVQEGPGRNALSYTFTEPGEFVLTYLETVQQDGKTIAVASARAQTRVVPVPAVPVGVAVNTEMEFAPPAGYQNYVWRIDGQEISRQPALKHRFQAPGTHTIECLASAPDQGPAQGFLRIRYNTTVNPR